MQVEVTGARSRRKGFPLVYLANGVTTRAGTIKNGTLVVPEVVVSGSSKVPFIKRTLFQTLRHYARFLCFQNYHTENESIAEEFPESQKFLWESFTGRIPGS